MSRLLSVSLPDDLGTETDEVARAQGRTRSEVVRDALRSYLWRARWTTECETARLNAERRGIGPEDAERLVDETRLAT